MGYYTKFQLKAELYKNLNVRNEYCSSCIKEYCEDYLYCPICSRKLKKIDVTDVVDKYLSENPVYGQRSVYDINQMNECKWYSYENDMKELSKKFPNILFTLSGKGEESFDIWRRYYLNGKFQHCPAKITFDEFDETKLK